jgi:DNA-binding MarR family transcriptional regulator
VPRELVDIGMRLARARDLRKEYLPEGLQTNEAWELLLAVYLAEQLNKETRVSIILNRAGLAHATGFAWMKRLEAAGLMRRHASPDDGRSAMLVLSDDARSRVGGLLQAVETVWI